MQGKLYIDGAFTDASDGATFTVQDPFSLETIGTQAAATATDLDRAIASSENAFGLWRKKTAPERAALLRSFATKLDEAQEEIARIMTQEQGKPLAEARGEIAYARSYVTWYAEEALRVNGDLIPSSAANTRLKVLKEPVGPVGIITPWNFPIAMFVRKLAPALAAGCTAIVKPPRVTPFTAVKVFELLHEVGFPKGVVQLVTGNSGLIGDKFLDAPGIRKISFTGSTEVGVQLMAGAAKTLKKLSLELGGHAPLLVFDDAEMALAVEGTINAKFRNCGQVCIAANRAYVQKSILSDYLDALVPAVNKLTQGSGLETVDMGPIIDEKAFRKIEGHVADALAKGATLVTGGKGERALEGRGGYFFAPTILTDVTPDMRIMQEETFGPVLPIATFDSEEEAIALANDTPFGLAAYFFSGGLSRVTRVEEELAYGMVGVNTGRISAAQAPFGGIKMSGFGREGGPYSIEEYLQTKYIATQI